ncbi:MAG: GHMP kinase [Bacteroidota bacterium]
MITTVAYPRAALIGNPSDGYFGKTIAFVFSNFKVEVYLHESELLEIIPGSRDRLVFKNIAELSAEVKQTGYYGGLRLIKATIKKFQDYCTQNNIALPQKNFTIGFSSTIPDRLGLAGSSAIVTASIKAILRFYQIDIPKPLLANLILSVEKDELHIGAGLQDRVAQVYGCPVFMNFKKELLVQQGYGEYLPFDKNLLPPLYIAYRTSLSEGSEITHNNFAKRYAENNAEVHEAIEQWTKLTEDAWEKLQTGDKNIGDLLNQNFDIRKKMMNVSKGNLQLVETARSVAASAKFTGSGGAIIGTYENEEMFDALKQTMKSINTEVFKPDIV